MAARDMPTIAASSYASSSFSFDENPQMMQAQLMPAASMRGRDPFLSNMELLNKLERGVPQVVARRVVQVFVADPNENVPLENCILYQGDVKVTDATDQELFFELDIRDLLEKHNAIRTKLVDKRVKDRTEYLEPAKVRDLKMNVVTVATL